MVKKRAKLAGQGREFFFSAEHKAQAKPGKEEIPAPEASAPAPSGTGKSASTGDLAARIKALQKLIKEFKKTVTSEEFNRLRLRDVEKM